VLIDAASGALTGKAANDGAEIPVRQGVTVTDTFKIGTSQTDPANVKKDNQLWAYLIKRETAPAADAVHPGHASLRLPLHDRRVRNPHRTFKYDSGFSRGGRSR
jgi:hypothetical protein